MTLKESIIFFLLTPDVLNFVAREKLARMHERCRFVSELLPTYTEVITHLVM